MESSKDDKGAPGLALALSRHGLAPPPNAQHDNFYTPKNETFYSQYKYCPLDRNRRQIRLLKVFPEEKTYEKQLADHPRWKTRSLNPALAKYSSVLACEMIDGVSLSNCTDKYLALSYAAGDATKTAMILVDGIIFNAFAQLVHAIKCAVRYEKRKDENEDGYILLWADQICIDQSNREERGHQVMMMREIYSECKATLVCLSVIDNSSVTQSTQRFWHKKYYNGLEWLTKMNGSTSLVDLFQDDCLDDERMILLKSFLVFLQCPWWTRSWVYQEFVCAPKVHFLFDEEDAPWEKISACLTPDPESWCDAWISRLASKSLLMLVRDKQQEYKEKLAEKLAPEFKGGKPGVFLMDRSFEIEVDRSFGDLVKRLAASDMKLSMRAVAAMAEGRSKRDSQVGDLRVLLRHARRFQASDTRDKIYAFIGLARNDYGFQPSYSDKNTSIHVLVDAARRIFEHDGDLTYILEQAFAGRKVLGLYLPTWVPDWNCHEDKRVLEELEQHARNHDKWNNGGDSPQILGSVDTSSDKRLDIDSPVNDGGSPQVLDSVDDSSEKKLDNGSRQTDSEQPSLRVIGRRIATLAQEWGEISLNLRQFKTDSGLVVYAPTSARPKNEIWSLSGCARLVFLRHLEENEYKFGGFVVVREFEDKLMPKEAAKEIFLI